MENKLREYLDGRTIQWLADKPGVYRNSVSAYLRGAKPFLDNAYSMDDVFVVSVYDIWPRRHTHVPSNKKEIVRCIGQPSAMLTSIANMLTRSFE